MKNLFIFFLSLLVCITTSCCKEPKLKLKSEQKLLDLHGNVKYAKVNVFYYKTSQNINIDTISNPTLITDLFNKSNYEINFNNDQTVKSISSLDSQYTATSIKINDSVTHIVNIRYNTKSMKIQTSSDTFVGNKYYDENNNLVATSELKFNPPKGYIIFNLFHVSGQILQQVLYHYKDNCDITRIDIKNYNYNEPSFAPLINTYYYEHDDKHSIISCTFEDLYGNINKCEYKYIYDEKGNWVEKVAFINGEKFSTTKREIQYL